MGQTLLLSEQDVRALLPMEDVVAAVEKTFRGMGDGTVVNPSKVNLDLGEIAPYPPYNGFMNAMPAYVGFSDVAGLKWAGGNLGERKKRGIPYCSSLILLVNPHINNFIAVLDFKQFLSHLQVQRADIYLDHVRLVWGDGQTAVQPERILQLVASMKGARMLPPASLMLPLPADKDFAQGLQGLRQALENIRTPEAPGDTA